MRIVNRRKSETGEHKNTVVGGRAARLLMRGLLLTAGGALGPPRGGLLGLTLRPTSELA